MRWRCFSDGCRYSRPARHICTGSVSMLFPLSRTHHCSLRSQRKSLVFIDSYATAFCLSLGEVILFGRSYRSIPQQDQYVGAQCRKFHYLPNRSLPWNLLAVFAIQCRAKVALLLEVVKFLFTATALPCLWRGRELVAMTIRMPHRSRLYVMAVRYSRTQVAMQWSLPTSVGAVCNKAARCRWLDQILFVLGAQ
jgi:hypothetical protein